MNVGSETGIEGRPLEKENDFDTITGKVHTGV